MGPHIFKQTSCLGSSAEVYDIGVSHERPAFYIKSKGSGYATLYEGSMQRLDVHGERSRGGASAYHEVDGAGRTAVMAKTGWLSDTRTLRDFYGYTYKWKHPAFRNLQCFRSDGTMIASCSKAGPFAGLEEGTLTLRDVVPHERLMLLIASAYVKLRQERKKTLAFNGSFTAVATTASASSGATTTVFILAQGTLSPPAATSFTNPTICYPALY